MTVFNPGCYVWNHRRLFASHICPHCGRLISSIFIRELFLICVRRVPHPRSRYRLTFLRSGFLHLGCGLTVGITGLAAGYCIGIVGDSGVRAFMQQSRIFVGMVLILIFGEVLGLYGYVTNKFDLAQLLTSSLV